MASVILVKEPKSLTFSKHKETHSTNMTEKQWQKEWTRINAF